MRSPFSRLKTLQFAITAYLASLAIFAAGSWQTAAAAPQFGPNKGAVVGIEFDGRMVADLDKSVAF